MVEIQQAGLAAEYEPRS